LNCRIDGWLGSETLNRWTDVSQKYPPSDRQGQAQRRAPVYQAVSILSGGSVAGCVRRHLCVRTLADISVQMDSSMSDSANLPCVERKCPPKRRFTGVNPVCRKQTETVSTGNPIESANRPLPIHFTHDKKYQVMWCVMTPKQDCVRATPDTGI
jgi:hypothetical protein